MTATAPADATIRLVDTTAGPVDPEDAGVAAEAAPGAALFGLAVSEKIRIDPTLDAEIDAEAARRFPGYSRPVVVAILVAEAAAIAGPKLANEHRHLSDLVKGYAPPAKLPTDTRVLAGTKALVGRVAAKQYPGAPAVEGLTVSLLMRLGLNRSTKKQPVLDPAAALALTLLTAKR